MRLKQSGDVATIPNMGNVVCAILGFLNHVGNEPRLRAGSFCKQPGLLQKPAKFAHILGSILRARYLFGLGSIVGNDYFSITRVVFGFACFRPLWLLVTDWCLRSPRILRIG